MCWDLEFVTGKTRFTVLAGFSERKKGTLLFKGKTESLVQRNTTPEEKGPFLFPAGEHRITRGEGRHRWRGNTVVITRAWKKCANQRTEPSQPSARATTEGFRGLKVRGHAQNVT